MPSVMCNSNVRTMLKEPLSQKEVANHDCDAPLKLDSTALFPAKMKLRSWLARVRSPYEIHPMMCCMEAQAQLPAVKCAGARMAHVLLGFMWARQLFVPTTSGSVTLE